MNTTDYVNIILSLLRSVLNGSSNYIELQKCVDNAVIEGLLPDDLSKDAIQHVFNLQTDLELVAENQSTCAGTNSILSQEEIVGILGVYEKKLLDQLNN